MFTINEMLAYDVFLLLCTVILVLGYMIAAELIIRAWSAYFTFLHHGNPPPHRRSYFMIDQIHNRRK